jgi:hypothetical protein
MAYGSDLLGDMHRHQSDEFTPGAGRRCLSTIQRVKPYQTL